MEKALDVWKHQCYRSLADSPLFNDLAATLRLESAYVSAIPVKSVSRRKIQAAQSLGANPWTIFRRVVFPASLPGIFTAIRVCIGIGVTMLVGAEMIATSNGIAWMALSAADFLLTETVLVAVLIMAALGYSLDLLARLAERRIVHWSGREG
ncbi:MAG: ABC transporter permease subunit [Burkholderiales bacterium]|nr:ABC transporter permease subunit [Burkholderiales bacterium]